MGQPRVYLFQSGMGSDQGALAKRVCLALSQVSIEEVPGSVRNPRFIVIALRRSLGLFLLLPLAIPAFFSESGHNIIIWVVFSVW